MPLNVIKNNVTEYSVSRFNNRRQSFARLSDWAGGNGPSFLAFYFDFSQVNIIAALYPVHLVSKALWTAISANASINTT
jgi:hypothetical protein